MKTKGDVPSNLKGVSGMLDFRCKCGDESEKEIRVSFCPKCKSRDVKYVFGFGNLFGVMPKMRCWGCGFASATFPVLVTNEKKLNAALRKVKKKVTKKVAPIRQSVPLKGKKKKVVKGG